MTPKEQLDSLTVGDTITYQMKTGQTTRQKVVTRTGVIAQILRKFITVKLDKYPDSIEVYQILNGKIQILEVVKKEVPPLPIEHVAIPSTLEVEPEAPKCTRTKQGTIDWDAMWPIIEPKIASGRDKYDVAKELGISKDAMKHQIKRRMPGLIDKPTQPAISTKTIKDLMKLQAYLRQAGKIIDGIISSIDETIKEESR